MNMKMDTKQKTSQGQQITLIGAVINAILIAIKTTAGLLGGSHALVVDAVHSLSDFFTDAVVLFGLRLSAKAPDEDHHFGHGRIETVTSALVGLALLVVGVLLAVDAGLAIYNRETGEPSWMALFGAAISVVVKESLYQATARVGRRTKSPLIIANAWHHRTDAMSSIAVLVGIGAAIFDPRFKILDAYAAGLVSFMIVWAGMTIVWDALKEVIDTAPSGEVMDQVISCARATEGVLEYHDIKGRSSGGLHQLQIHIVVEGQLTVTEGHAIAADLKRQILQKVSDVSEVIIHMDPSR